jgi:hypothetical protein
MQDARAVARVGVPMEEPSANQASLTVLGGTKAGLRFLIEDSVDNIVIGSDPSCRFHIDLPGVSPVHARLWIDPQGVTVYETNSPRGLYVNDDRVVAQAPLRNGDILWLGTPGDEDVVMIQCRLPQAKVQPRPAAPAIPEDAVGETVALGALPTGSDTVVAEPEVDAESEPAAVEPIVEPEAPSPSEPEPVAEPFVDEPAAAVPATEVFMVDDPLYENASQQPSFAASEPAAFEMDFTRAAPSFAVDPEVEAAQEAAAVMAASPASADDLAAPQAEEPPVRETRQPAPVESPAPIPPPPPPRRAPARPSPAVVPPPRQEPAAAGSSSAAKYGLLAAAAIVVAVGGFLAVRALRQPTPARVASAPTPPPTTIAPVPPSTEAPATVEASPSAMPAPPTTIPEEVVVVPQATPSPLRPTPAASRSPSPPASASPRPSPKTAAASPPPATPAPVAPAPPGASQVAGLLGQAAAAVSGRQFDAAITAFDEVLKIDPQNASAAQGRAAAHDAAAEYKRGFSSGRTSLSGKEAKADLGGFDTSGVKVAKVPDYSGRIEFEVTPPRVLAGDSYTVRIFLVNDGKKAFKIGSITVSMLLNGSRSGGPVAARTREIEPRDRVLLDERTAEWAANTTSWTMEAVVGSDRDATFTNRLNWR